MVDFSDLGGVPVQSSQGGGIDFSDLGGMPLIQQHPSPQQDPLNFERSSDYPSSWRMDATVPDLMTAHAVLKAPALAFNLTRAGIGGIGKLIGKVKDIRNAPKALEDALGSSVGRFGTTETPSMVGNAARTSLQSEESLNEALANKFYGNVPRDVPISTPRLAEGYQKIADELPPSLGNAIKKNIQLEPNPIRPGDTGEFRGITTKIPPSQAERSSSLVDKQGNALKFKENVPGRTEYGIGYSASPGTPTQLPPNNPPVGELMKLRSKLGAASRSGGVDGYNAGQLKAALDEDIANLGASEGPLGKFTNEAVNQPLKKATNYYREMMQQQKSPLYKKLAEGKIEDIPNIVFKRGRTQDVLEARAALGEHGFQAAKKSFFNDIINSKDIGKELAKYGKNNSDFLQSSFNPVELRSLETVADLQQKAIEAAKNAERAKILIGVGAAAVGGGLTGKAVKFGLDSK